MKKKLYIILLILGLILIIAISWSVSSRVMQYKVKDKTPSKKTEVKEEEQEDKDTKGFKKDSEIVIGDKTFAKTERIFDSDSLLERQQKFLGQNYETLKPALDYIESDYDSIFKEIGDVNNAEYDFDSYIDVSKNPINIFSEEFLNSGMTAYNPTGGTIVGMYGTHCIVYQLWYGTDFAQPLIAYDYTDMHIDVEQQGLFGFGQNKSFYVDSKYSKLVNYGDYSVLYVRGY